jgi:sigma-B regulation protein RsbU (phosphoserine phosphatase)
MKILLAEDDAVSRRLVEVLLKGRGHEVISVEDGLAAWMALESLEKENSPAVAILDWMMPKMDGIEVCRKVRDSHRSSPVHIILLTARGNKEDIITGLEAGAADYLTKPVWKGELRARLGVGIRIVELQSSLADRIHKLETALKNVKQLQGLLPICCYCKKVRNDHDYWQQVDAYVSQHTEVQFSHGICPDCFEKIVRPEMAELSVESESWS